MTKNGHPGHRHVAEAVQRHRLVALVVAAQAAPAVGGVRVAQVDDAELLLVVRRARSLDHRNNEGQDVAQRLGANRLEPSGISERRVFSRVAMSSFLISTSPFVLRRVTADAFSLAITPASVSPFFVVTFHCQ